MKENSQKKKRIKRAALLLLAALTLVLAGCGRKTPESQIPTETVEEPREMDNRYYYSGDSEESYLQFSNQMDAENCGLAVFDLGENPELRDCLNKEEPDWQKADELLQELLERSGLLQQLSFLRHIPSTRILTLGEGSRLFCVLPDAGAEGLRVFHTALSAEGVREKGELLQEVKGAYPLMILGDDVYVEENGGKGISAMLPLAETVPEGVLDLNGEQPEITAEDLAGTWCASGIQDDAGNRFNIYLEFDKDGGMRCHYAGTGADVLENRTRVHFTGTWTKLSARRFEISAKADGGLLLDAGAPAFEMNAVYELFFGNGTKTVLRAKRISGDPIMTGIPDGELCFIKEAE